MFGALTIEGQDTTQDYQLTQPATALGRAGDSDLCLQHPTVSLHHARILCDPSGCRIMDPGSSNGTYVDGAELSVNTKHALQDGELIQIGPFRLHFRWTPPLEADTPRLATGAVTSLPEHEATVVLAPKTPPRLVVGTP